MSIISSYYSLVIIVRSPPIRFIIVSRFSIQRPPFKSTTTLLSYASFPAILYTLALGYSRP